MLYLSQSLVRCALQNVIKIDKKYFGTVMAHPASHSNTSPHNTCYPILTFASSFEHNLGTLRCVCGLLYFVNICEGCFFFSRVDSTRYFSEVCKDLVLQNLHRGPEVSLLVWPWDLCSGISGISAIWSYICSGIFYLGGLKDQTDVFPYRSFHLK